jgi:hypothetical protein
MSELDTRLTDADPVDADALTPSFEALWQTFESGPLSARNSGRRRPRYRTSGAIALAGALAAVLAVVLIPGGSAVRPASAGAAVLKRAAAAFDRPNAILLIRVRDHNANGWGTRMLGGNGPLGVMCVPSSCDSPPPATARTGISANPDKDALTYSLEEWASPDGRQVHAIYSNGDELVRNATRDQYSAYDPADDALTVLSHVSYGSPAQTPLATLAEHEFDGSLIPFIEDPSYYKDLFQGAKSGTERTEQAGVSRISARLLGRTTIGRKPVYELRFDVYRAALPKQRILLYIDTRSFLPVRSVGIVFNAHDLTGAPPGTAVTDVADYSVVIEPATATNDALLRMRQHPGAKQVHATYAHYLADHGPPSRPDPRTSTGARDAREDGWVPARGRRPDHT